MASNVAGPAKAAQAHPKSVYALFGGGLYSGGLIVTFASAARERVLPATKQKKAANIAKLADLLTKPR
jgi:hypothetical protein